MDFSNPWASQRSENDPLLQRHRSEDNEQSAINRRIDELVSKLGRVAYLDDIRVFLTILVVYHHASSAYGGAGAWYYSPDSCQPWTSMPLKGFTLYTYSFFMALFFFLSGHFSSQSLKKKGRYKFMKDRLWRLGIPIVVYRFIGEPLIYVMIAHAKHWDAGTVWMKVKEAFTTWRIAAGPTWFICVLLCFDTILVLLSFVALRRPHFLSNLNKEKFTVIAICAIALDIITTFLVRVSWPMDRFVLLFMMLPGMVPQYILAYSTGLVFSKVEPYLTQARYPRFALLWRHAFIIVPAVVVSRILGIDRIRGDWKGGWNLIAFLYVFWNEVSFYLIGTGWLIYFYFLESDQPVSSSALSKPSLLEKKAFRLRNILPARYSYGVYLFHALVLTAIQVILDGFFKKAWREGPISCEGKAITTGTLSVVFTWLLVWQLIKWVPGVGRVI